MSNGKLSHLVATIAMRHAVKRNGGTLEEGSPVLEGLEAVAAAPHPDDVAALVESTLSSIPDDEKGDPIQFRKAVDLVVSHSREALRQYGIAPEHVGRDGQASLEAVVKADGSRPSLLLRDGVANKDHPLAGQWRNSIGEYRDKVKKLADSVGRIGPASASSTNYFGTGWVVDSTKGLVLTNRHVLEAMLNRATTIYDMKDKTYRIYEGCFIDFDAQTGSASSKLFRIVEATPAAAAGGNYVDLDAAVLRIEAIADAGAADGKVPDSVQIVADLDAVRQGSLPSLCIVGFPGPPPSTTGTESVPGGGTIDWKWVDSVLFGSKYGLKRLAIGKVSEPVGSRPTLDPHAWIFGHDLTTLGGNSGSPAFAWTAPGEGYAFGLHFAGSTLEVNEAHSLALAADGLRRLGVPVSADES